MAGAAAVKIQEIDLSSRVASFEGVYGAIVVPAKKGDHERPTLTVTDTQFLDRYTPDGRVEVGYDLSYFSALAFLERSDKLWVRRVVKQAYYAGISIKTTSAATNNQALPSDQNLEDIDNYVFDSNNDVEGVAEVTSVQFVSNLLLDGMGILLEDQNGTVAFWVDVDDSGTALPGWAASADRAVEVTSITTADLADANAIAAKMQAAIDADAQFSVTVSDDTIVITDAAEGARADAIDQGTNADIEVTTQGVDEVNAVDECMLIYASNPGEWGNEILVKITSYLDDPDLVAEPDSFLIQVYKSNALGTPVEEWLCSRIEGKKDGYGRNLYIEDVLQGSNYIRVKDNLAVAGSVYPKSQSVQLQMNGGDDGLSIGASEMVAAADDYSNPDDLSVTLLLDGGFAVPSYQVALDTIAKNRMDCVAILSTPYADEISSNYLSDLIDYRKTDLNLNSSYSALYTPHVKIQDRFNDREIFVAPDGYVAASISFSANSREIWFPPAGFRRGVLNVTDVSRRFESGELDALYNVGINPIRFAPGRGIVIWGQKTLLSRPSALNRLNVRLLLIVIEPAIKELLEDFLFEFNDRATRSEVSAKLSGYMDSVRARRGVVDYQVICDESNNLANDIDNNKLIVDLFIKPTISIEEIPFRVVIVSNDISFSDAAASI